MRESTRKKIDALHAEIQKLIEAEKAHYDKKNPDQRDFIQMIAHTKIEFHQHTPLYRRLAAEQSAYYAAQVKAQYGDD